MFKILKFEKISKILQKFRAKIIPTETEKEIFLKFHQKFLVGVNISGQNFFGQLGTPQGVSIGF